jgi:hypothetical protein
VVVLVFVTAVEQMGVVGGESDVAALHRRSVARLRRGTAGISRSGGAARLAGR